MTMSQDISQICFCCSAGQTLFALTAAGSHCAVIGPRAAEGARGRSLRGCGGGCDSARESAGVIQAPVLSFTACTVIS